MPKTRYVAKKSQSKLGWLVAGVGVVAVVLLIASLLLNGSSAMPAEISVDQALEKRNQGALMLDVREPSEWNEGHIPEATLIPLGELEARLAELPRDQEIVVVCRSGNRSATGRDILRQAGFEQVTSMAGGMNQWSAKGFPTVVGP
jgi:rhodanese-related sulfurtransferase